MTWVKLDDQMTEHPKVLAAGPFGLALFVAALAYCNRNLTDGFVPRPAMSTLLCPEWVDKDGKVWVAAATCGMSGFDLELIQLAEQLVDVGLLHHAPGGYLVHDYLDYQPSKEKVLEEREGARKRQEASRSRKKLQRDTSVSHGDVTGEVTREFGSPVPEPVPVPVPIEDQQPIEEHESGNLGTLSYGHALRLFAAIRDGHKDDRTKDVVLSYASKLPPAAFEDIRERLEKGRHKIKNEGAWVNAALAKKVAA